MQTFSSMHEFNVNMSCDDLTGIFSCFGPLFQDSQLVLNIVCALQAVQQPKFRVKEGKNASMVKKTTGKM